MKTHRFHLYAMAVCIQFAATGCNSGRPAQSSPPSDGRGIQTSGSVDKSADPNPRLPQQPGQSPIAAETPARASVPNPLYHPGATESLDLSGTFEGKETITISGKITLIVTKETSHDRPVNVMNTVVELHFPDGKRHQLQTKSVCGAQSDGSLKLLYKDTDSGRRWVESDTCPREPSDYIEGRTDGCEVHYDDGSTEKSTSTVTKDGDYLKVTWISADTDAQGEHDSSETYWFDMSTNHLVRYSGSVSAADGSQMTLSGR
jgi:hypothetical protein